MKKVIFLMLFSAILMVANNSFAGSISPDKGKKCCDCKSCETIKHKCCDKEGNCGKGKKECNMSSTEECCKDSKCKEDGKKCCTSEKGKDKKKSCCK